MTKLPCHSRYCDRHLFDDGNKRTAQAVREPPAKRNDMVIDANKVRALIAPPKHACDRWAKYPARRRGDDMKKMIINQLEELEYMAKSGAIVVLKMDGDRFSQGDAKLFTLMISGGNLGADDFFRQDGESLSEVIGEGLGYYATKRLK